MSFFEPNERVFLKTGYNLVPEEHNQEPHLSVLAKKANSCVMA